MTAPGPDGIVCGNGCDAWSINSDCPQHRTRTRQRWHYQGRGEVDGIDSYVWHAYVDTGGRIRKAACALSVADFWPNRCFFCEAFAVIDTSWGWECTACGQYDVAVGCTR